jgi:hypothetical protein
VLASIRVLLYRTTSSAGVNPGRTFLSFLSVPSGLLDPGINLSSPSPIIPETLDAMLALTDWFRILDLPTNSINGTKKRLVAAVHVIV